MFQTNVAEKNQNLRFIFSSFARKLCLFETMWKNIVETHRPQNTIQCCAEKIRFACRI